MTTKQSGAKKAEKKSARKPATPTVRRWSAKVTTDATHPEHDLFNQDARTVAEHLASKKVSPKGPASGMRMLNFYINRAGKNLTEERHAELEKAKGILSGIIAEQKSLTKRSPVKRAVVKRSAAHKSAARKTG